LPFCCHFEIDIISALTEQLVAAIAQLDQGSLSSANIESIPNERGVYQLFYLGILVYVGKADNLKSRLKQHLRKISGRRNISAADVTFRCLTVHRNWTALAPEETLIKHYKEEGLCAWNGNGFGTHDPGRRREETNKPPESFDAQYPIREDWPCAEITACPWNARELLVALKKQLPFLLRYDKAVRGHVEHLTIDVPQTGMPAVQILQLIATHLPGWQATRFSSHMILYREDRSYTHGTKIWPLS
jgi:hypothetical protein